VSVEQVIAERRSRRSFASAPVPEREIAQILWAAQGITADNGGRTVPSAGGLYPLELFVARRDGLLHYSPTRHQCVEVREADVRPILWKHGLEQEVLRDAPCVFLISALFGKTRATYSVAAERYVYIEAGHVAQNILLQAGALGLAGVPIGAFDDDLAADLALPGGEVPIYCVSIGSPRG
jgi:SagB-type dehydrogenase family enzyme